MKYKAIEKFLKLSVSSILILLILCQPCFAFVSQPLPVPNSQLITYTYDALNRLDLKTYPDASTVDYAYDLGSRLTSIENPASSIQYQYDNLNRIATATNTLNSTPYTLNYNYDKLGNRTKLTYPSGTVLDYFYNANNELIQVKKDNALLASFAYDPLGRRITKDLRSSQIERSSYTYDAANQLTNLKNFVYSGGGDGILPRKIPADDGGSLGSINTDEKIQMNIAVAHPVIRQSGTGESGNQEISDNIVPDYQITQSPSPGSPDHQMPSSRLWSMVSGLWSVQDAEASLPLLNSQFTYTYDNVGNRLTQRTQQAQQTQQWEAPRTFIEMIIK